MNADINLLYSIWTQLIESIRSGSEENALDCLDMMRKHIIDVEEKEHE